MIRHLRTISIATVTCALAISIVGVIRSATPDESSVAPARQEWPQATGDLGNMRFSALSQINTETVKNLGAAWVSDKFDDAGTSRVTPAVKDGMMFLTAGAKIYALDAKTGKTLWKFMPAEVSVDPMRPGGGGGIFPSGRGVPNTQGVAVGEGKVFVGLNTGQMIALDEKTGNVVWSRVVSEDITPSLRASISASPVYANGVIYTCVAFNEGRYIGRALALDAKDGHQLWRWDSVPGPGEPGHETWTTDPKSIFWRMGGADVWMPPVVDQDLGLVYYGTGNPSPNTVGDVRPGNNLYSCSIVALDIRTGKLRWYYQVTHHDLWESDIAQPIVLYDTQVDGHMRKGVAALRPDGTLFLLDRATGKPIFPVEERQVRQSALYKTSPTQPFPVGRGSLIERDCSQWTAPPGFTMRCEFFQPLSDDPPNILSYAPTTRSSPMSFSPQTGYFYLQGVDRMIWAWNSPKPPTWEFGSTLQLTFRVPNLERQSVMVFAAVDPRTYKVVWRKQMRMPATVYGVGGFLSTAGGLAFHRLEDGNLVAYDAKTGDELWKFQTGVAGTSTASAMSYEVDGQQYVAIPEESQVWCFRLGGTIAQRPAPKLPPDVDILLGPTQDTQVIRVAIPDDYNYKHDTSPMKARVKAGSDVTFINNSAQIHTFVSEDGTWTTGTLLPRQQAIVTFDKPGTYLYHCKEHPWAYAMVTVTGVAASAKQQPSGNPAAAKDAKPGGQPDFTAQAVR